MGAFEATNLQMVTCYNALVKIGAVRAVKLRAAWDR